MSKIQAESKVFIAKVFLLNKIHAVANVGERKFLMTNGHGFNWILYENTCAKWFQVSRCVSIWIGEIFKTFWQSHATFASHSEKEIMSWHHFLLSFKLTFFSKLFD